MGDSKWVDYGVAKNEHEPIVWFRCRTNQPVRPTGAIEKAYKAIGHLSNRVKVTQKYSYYECPLWFAPVLFNVFQNKQRNTRLAIVLPNKLSQIIIRETDAAHKPNTRADEQNRSPVRSYFRS